MSTTMTVNSKDPVANRRVVVIMAIAVGAIIANLYYAQPLVDTLSRTFEVSSTAVGAVITLIQVTYAVGLATLVPLGDLLERRRLLAVMLCCATAGMTAMALAPSIAVFGAAAALVGLTSVAVQVLVPFAAHIAAQGQQARVVGIVMTGLLLGILLARTVAGIVAGLAGWRAVFALGAVLTAGVALLLWRALPRIAPAVQMSYPTLLGSVLALVREEPVLRMRILYGALTFASFSAFWASAGFLLAREPYGWNNAEIGAFALFGALGAVAAQFVGRLTDRGLAHLATGAFLLVMVASYGLLAVGAESVVALAIGVVLMDLGCQATHISNQSLIFPLRPEARSRLNTAYMTSYFVAGALGSAASVAAYPAYGWAGVCVVGAAFPSAALLIWAADTVRRRGLTVVSS